MSNKIDFIKYKNIKKYINSELKSRSDKNLVKELNRHIQKTLDDANERRKLSKNKTIMIKHI